MARSGPRRMRLTPDCMRNRDPCLAYTRVGPFFDPLRQEPRFQAIEQKLKFVD